MRHRFESWLLTPSYKAMNRPALERRFVAAGANASGLDGLSGSEQTARVEFDQNESANRADGL